MSGVTLVGYRGCGKTTVARLLARRLGLPAIDADDVLEARAGRSIAALVADAGEPAFRDLESEVLAELLAGPPAVLATGGGVVLRDVNRARLRSSGRPVIWLQADASVIRSRLAADPTTASRRPGLTGADPLAEVADALAARAPLYAEVADVAFDATSDGVERIVESIVGWLDAGRPSGTAPENAS
jgi:shikimate kinase